MENLNLTDEQGNIIKGVTRKTKSGVGIKRTRLKGSVKTLSNWRDYSEWGEGDKKEWKRFVLT